MSMKKKLGKKTAEAPKGPAQKKAPATPTGPKPGS